MAVPSFGFTPAGGLTDKSSYPTVPANEDAARLQIQTPMNQLRDYLNTNIPLLAEKSEILRKTTAHITYYVNPAGNNSNDGTSAGSALQTIQEAVNRIPQVLNHNINIELATGTYAEDVQISGFVGKGLIYIYGQSLSSANHAVRSFIIENCDYVKTTSINVNSTTASGMSIFNSYVHIDSCSCTAAAARDGFNISSSVVRVENCGISNRNAAIASYAGSIVYSSTNFGTGNTYGLYCGSASKIGKNGGQPGGTTAEGTAGGGQIL